MIPLTTGVPRCCACQPLGDLGYDKILFYFGCKSERIDAAVHIIDQERIWKTLDKARRRRPPTAVEPHGSTATLEPLLVCNKALARVALRRDT